MRYLYINLYKNKEINILKRESFLPNRIILNDFNRLTLKVCRTGRKPTQAPSSAMQKPCQINKGPSFLDKKHAKISTEVLAQSLI